MGLPKIEIISEYVRDSGWGESHCFPEFFQLCEIYHKFTYKPVKVFISRGPSGANPVVLDSLKFKLHLDLEKQLANNLTSGFFFF